MIHAEKRIGNFTSSGIYKLMKSGSRKMTEIELELYKVENPKGRRTTIDVDFGDLALTYISEKQMERKLGRCLNDVGSAKPLIWGRVCEKIAFDLLGIEYTLISQDTIIHPEIPFFSGSPDGKKEGVVYDIKCPYTIKSFCTFAECKDIAEIREKHPDGEKYYWQLVSNAILTDCDKGELIIYCPYKSELEKIRTECENYDDPNKVAWIVFSNDDDLPYLIDGKFYKNLYKFEFDIPNEDKDYLINRIKKAEELLEKSH
jgi:hypothetical protein